MIRIAIKKWVAQGKPDTPVRLWGFTEEQDQTHQARISAMSDLYMGHDVSGNLEIEVDGDNFTVIYERVEDGNIVALRKSERVRKSAKITCSNSHIEPSGWCTQCGQYHVTPNIGTKNVARLEQLKRRWIAGLSARGIPLQSGTAPTAKEGMWIGDFEDHDKDGD